MSLSFFLKNEASTDTEVSIQTISKQDVFQALQLVVSSSLSIYQHPCKEYRLLHIKV